jgi:hypothetical protein
MPVSRATMPYTKIKYNAFSCWRWERDLQDKDKEKVTILTKENTTASTYTNMHIGMVH